MILVTTFNDEEPLYDVSQQVRFTQKAPYTYLAQYWTWTSSSDGGYVGLQPNGSRFNGTVGEMAIYSLWNATGAKAATGVTCGQFDGEGTGWSCRRGLAINSTHFYRLSVVRGAADATGQWWKASVQDMSTKSTYGLGSIRVVSTARFMSAPMNFSEYFGPAVPTCNDVPTSIADWKRPVENSTTSGYGVTGSSDGGQRGACTGGTVTPRTLNTVPGVRMVMGGPVS